MLKTVNINYIVIIYIIYYNILSQSLFRFGEISFLID